MTFTHHKVLNYSSQDSKGKRPETKWLGKTFFHLKTRRLYTVRGFVWNSSNDTWEVKYGRDGCDVEFTRVIEEFADTNRFVQVDNSSTDGDY